MINLALAAVALWLHSQGFYLATGFVDVLLIGSIAYDVTEMVRTVRAIRG